MGINDVYPEDDEASEWEGYTNEDGDHNIIDDVSLDEPTENFFRQEMRKVVSGDDRFASMAWSQLDPNTKRKVKRLEKKLQGTGGAKAKHINVEEVNGYMVYDLALPPYNLDSLVDLSTENDTHWACISLKARNIVGLGHTWKETYKTKEARSNFEDDDEKMKKFAKKLQRVTLAMDEWLDGLNEEDELAETFLQVWLDVEATGNGYLEIGRNRDGSIGYLGHIPAATMRVRAARDGFVQLVYAGQSSHSLGKNDKPIFFRNFGDLETPDLFGKDPRPNEVIHIKKHSPKNAYYGVPDIIAAMSSVAGEKFANEYNLDYFENKAVPRYALIVKGAKLSLQAERKILDYFRREVKGKHHGTLYIPVPAHMGSNVDVKLEPIENKVQEAGFEKYRQGNRSSIAMVHNVPLSKLGVGGSVTAAREDDKAFKVQVCKPDQKRFAQKVNRIIKTKTDLFKFEFEEYDLIDEETKSRIHDRYVRIGVMNPDEVRGDRGLHPRKGGNKFVDLASESEAKIEAATMKAQGIGQGADRKTTDGSPKHKQQNHTPKNETPEGKGAPGTAIDRGETKSTRR